MTGARCRRPFCALAPTLTRRDAVPSAAFGSQNRGSEAAKAISRCQGCTDAAHVAAFEVSGNGPLQCSGTRVPAAHEPQTRTSMSQQAHRCMRSTAPGVYPLSYDYVSSVPPPPRHESVPAAPLLQVLSLAISTGFSLWAMNYILVKMDPSASAKAAASTERAKLERRLGRRFIPPAIQHPVRSCARPL